jgi:phasin family protein
MAKTSNPFGDFDLSKMMDPSKFMEAAKMMPDFKMNGVDMEGVMASQRRNIEALTNANRLAAEGVQAIAKRQAEIMRQTMEEMGRAMKDAMAMASPEEKAARQTEMMKDAFQRAISNMRELAEMVSKSQNEAFDVINKRVADSLDEIKGLMAKRQG